jgi:uncharacterized membrane protein YphA (DoxX/SURF4 family)
MPGRLRADIAPRIAQKGNASLVYFGVVGEALFLQPASVQRLFSMFPTGWPGLGLMLLRMAVSAPLLRDGLYYWNTLALWVVIGLLVLSIMLFLGALTPVASLFAATAECAIRATPGYSLSMALILNALALMLLGPGAYSLDGYCFGRRVVVLPPDGE